MVGGAVIRTNRSLILLSHGFLATCAGYIRPDDFGGIYLKWRNLVVKTRVVSIQQSWILLLPYPWEGRNQSQFYSKFNLFSRVNVQEALIKNLVT